MIDFKIPKEEIRRLNRRIKWEKERRDENNINQKVQIFKDKGEKRNKSRHDSNRKAIERSLYNDEDF